jgi:iron complex outermembrane receptor protein
MSVVLKDVQSQTDLAVNENVTDGYSMLNMKISNMFTLSNDVDLYVSIFGRNLLNEIARNHASFVKNEVPLPGKSYGLKFSAEF